MRREHWRLLIRGEVLAVLCWRQQGKPSKAAVISPEEDFLTADGMDLAYIHIYAKLMTRNAACLGMKRELE